MTSPMDNLREKIAQGALEETPDGPVIVIFDGRQGIRLVVDPARGSATASTAAYKHTAQNSDLAVAAKRALSAVLTGGIS